MMAQVCHLQDPVDMVHRRPLAFQLLVVHRCRTQEKSQTAAGYDGQHLTGLTGLRISQVCVWLFGGSV